MLPNTKTLTLVCLLLVSGINSLLAQVVANAGANQTICSGSDVTIGGSPTGAGGTPPYTYIWNNGVAPTANPTVTTVATIRYTVTVTDANSNTATASVTITVKPNPVANAGPNQTLEGCSPTGIVIGGTPTASGGGAPYTYSWTPVVAISSNTIANPAVQGLGTNVNYTVVVTDINGCTASSSVMVSVNTSSPSVQVGWPSGDTTWCAGSGSNVNLVAYITGGTSPYSYVWGGTDIAPTNAQIATVNPDVAGHYTYTVTVTDAGNCTATASEVIGVIAPPQIDSLHIVNAGCNGGSSGSVCVYASGADGPLTYGWSNGSTSQCITGLYAWDYTVTVTDLLGCATSDTAVISQPVRLQGSIIITNVICNGGANGSACITVTGGTAPYSLYQWSTGATGQCITQLSPNTYIITVEDANGCTLVDTAVITQPNAITINAASITNASCFGGNDGSICETVNGGTPPYTYVWSNTAITQCLNSLQAGTYTVTITDANGCSATASATITQPAALNINVSATGTHVLPDTAGLLVSGGTGPYTITWGDGQNSNLPGDTASHIYSIEGVYTITVNDAHSCSSTYTLLVDTALLLIANAGNDTTICRYNGVTLGGNPTASGGTPPYTYAWSDGSTTANPFAVAGITYILTVTDANSVSATSSITVTLGPGLNAAFTVPATCEGASSVFTDQSTFPGSIIAWSWNFGDGTTSTVQNPNHTFATGGTYPVTLIVSNGVCNADTTINVTINAAPTADFTATSPVCEGTNSDIVYTGGAPANDTYTWNFSGGTVASGSGQGPYEVNWSTGGNETVTLVVSVGTCSSPPAQQVIVVNPFPGLIAPPDTSICTGGTVTLVASGANSYTWSPATGLNATNTATVIATPATTTNYTVTGNNANCNGIAYVTVAVNPVPTSTFMVTSPVCLGQNATITYTGNAGTGANYIWNFNGGSANTTTGQGPIQVNWTTAGTQNVTLTVVQNGCTSVETTQPVLVNALPIMTVSSNTSVSCGGSATLTASGATTYTWTPSSGLNSTNTASVIATPGFTTKYFVTGTSNACAATDSVTVTVTGGPQIDSFATHNPSCFNGNNGSVCVYVSGGTSPYNYDWSNGATGQCIANLSANPMEVLVADANGCEINWTTTVITQPDSLQDLIVATGISCYGDSNGVANMLVAGGVLPYNFNWSNGETTEHLTNVKGGTYTVTITDAHNCVLIDSAIVANPGPLYTSGIVKNVSCFGNQDGEVTVTPYGGTLPYAYEWSNGPSIGLIIGLNGGNYFLTITDANGCSVASLYVVHEPAPLTVGITATPVTCYAGSNGMVAAIPGGGTTPYHYLWSNFGSDSAQSVTAGTYSLQLTDSNGCSASASATVTQPATQFTLQVFTPDTNAIPDSVTFFVSGGNAPYLFSWDNGQTNSTGQFVYNTAGVYLDTITDANGCVLTYTVDAACTDQCVWPGDANYDGVVDNNDLLAIGIGYDTTGPARLNPTINFIPQYCALWADTLIGAINYKHVDCNGDGIINAWDTTAIMLNYSLVHPRSSNGGGGWKADDPGLYISTNTDTVADGQILTATLSLGNQALPVTNAYALAFTYNFDPLVVDTTDVNFNVGNSWLFGAGNHINISKNFYPEGQVQIAITRIDHTNKSGYGPIASISMKITTGNINGKNLQYYLMNNFISNLTVIENNGQVIPVNAGADSVQVAFSPTNIIPVNANTQIQIFPNPASDQLNIVSTQSIIEEITIVDLAGQQVIHQDAKAGNYSTIDISGLSAGVYLIQLKTAGQEYHSRFVKVGK